MSSDNVERINGELHLVRDGHHSEPRVQANMDRHKESKIDRHAGKMRRIEFKKTQQKNNGWPADKSPI